MGQGGLRGGQGSGSTSGSVELIILGFLFGFFSAQIYTRFVLQELTRSAQSVSPRPTPSRESV